MWKRPLKLSIAHIVRTPPPFLKGGGFNFFKIDGNGGLKIFARKWGGGGVGKMGGVSRNGGGVAILYSGFSGDSS